MSGWPKAHEVFRALGGIPARGGYLCRCPVPSHGQGKGDRHPSLSVRDGDHKLLLHCFAGCEAADIEGELAKLDLTKLAPEAVRVVRPSKPKTSTADALALWAQGQSMPGTHGAAYLAARRLPDDMPTLRFLPSYPLLGKTYPAILAALQSPSRDICSVQVTLLHPTLPRKAALLEPRRIIGPSRGFALRLAAATDTLGLAEGYESGHAAMLRYGVAVWCSLGAPRLPFVTVPNTVRKLVVFADPDEPGLTGARRVIEVHPDREVIVIAPPDERDHAQWWQEDPCPLPLPFS